MAADSMNYTHKFDKAFLKNAVLKTASAATFNVASGFTVQAAPRVDNPTASTDAFHGLTNVSSINVGLTAVVSTTAVKSDSYIWWGLKGTGATSAHVPFVFHVATVADGGFFRFLGTWNTAATSAAVGSFQVFWRIEQPV